MDIRRGRTSKLGGKLSFADCTWHTGEYVAFRERSQSVTVSLDGD